MFGGASEAGDSFREGGDRSFRLGFPQMAGRQKRKRRKTRERTRPDPASARVEPQAVEPRKSKDDIAREQLVPLAEGERPGAVTVAAAVAAALVLAWIVVVATGDSGAAAGAPVAILLAVAAWGMWRARYWAVLGFQVLLGLTIVNTGLFLLLKADDVIDFVVAVPLLAAAGTLFWRLVRSLARLQMPQRRQPG